METASSIERLLDATLGDGVLPSGAVREYVESDAATVLVAETDGDAAPEIRPAERDADPDTSVVGVSIAREFSDTEALSEHPYLHADPVEVLDELGLTDASFPVGSVLVSCIATDYQGRGLGGEITLAAMDALLQSGLTPILQFEWDRPDSPGVAKLKEAGFTPQARLEDHFPAGWHCPACESRSDVGRCTCDVVVFLL